MATITSTVISDDDAFSTFTELSTVVCMRDPTGDLNEQLKRRPLTIFLLFWMNAAPRHTGKYASEYIKLAPYARIVCLTVSSSDFLSFADQSRKVVPAVDILQSAVAAGDSLYFHVFSNGGCLRLQQLSTRYAAATGKPIPIKSLVVDSAPGNSTLSRSFKAFSYGLPKQFLLRLLAKCVAWVYLVCIFALRKLFRGQLPARVASRALNDAKLISLKTQRCYIYSDADELIFSKDVEEHAHESEKLGWSVERQKFEGSPHVAHMRVNPDRYWGIVIRFLEIAAK